MTISKIKAAEKLIRTGLDSYYNTRLEALRQQRDTLLDSGRNTAIEYLEKTIHKLTAEDVEVMSDGVCIVSFVHPELSDRLESIDYNLKALQDEYSKKLELLEAWVNYAIINDNNLTNAPNIPEELKPFYDIAVVQFQEE